MFYYIIIIMTTGFVYQICSQDSSLCYIGSTTKNNLERFYLHKSAYKRWVKDPSNGYCSSYKLLCSENAHVVLLESVNFKRDLKARLKKLENYYMRLFPCVNIRNSIFDYNDYYNTNKDRIQKYYLANCNKKKKYQIDRYNLKRELKYYNI
jgi:hypothetical protein